MNVQTVEVAEGIYEMRPEPALEVSCASYLIKAPRPALIETGPGYQAQAILKALNGMGQIPSYVILTHNHFDHCGGVGQFIAAVPETTIVAHEKTVRHLVDPTRLVRGIKRVFGDDFEQTYGAVLPVPEERILAVRDGSVISLGDRELHIVHAPGHVGHQISVYDPRSQGLFAGDAIGGPFQGAEYWLNVAPPDFDMELQLETIKELKRLSPRYLCYAHCDTTHDVKRIFELAEPTTRDCGEIILRATRAGETTDRIKERIRDYTGFTGPDEPWLDFLGIPGYLHYFSQKGMI